MICNLLRVSRFDFQRETALLRAASFFLLVSLALLPTERLAAQMLEQRLLAEDPQALAAAARTQGDARRGAILFYQPYLTCRKCHTLDQAAGALGPDLTQPDPQFNDILLVESLLEPSKRIREGFQAVTVLTTDGRTVTGLVADETPAGLTLRDAAQDGRTLVLERSQIEEVRPAHASLMPAGLVNQLASRQQFLDLLRYLIEIREQGSERAGELEPDPALYAARPLPDYEQHLDHAGLIAGWDDTALERGRAIYERLCINCHGTHDRPGSLPTSPRFAADKLKSGSDPYTMYQTLTRGFGMMAPQTWMVPRQKYDVIHYIRQAYLRHDNPQQYFAVGDDYLASLPSGDTFGPPPSEIVPWEQMDYGPNLVATYEIGRDGSNFAYKGNAIRLDAGPGGVSRGRAWILYDYDTLRVAAAWSGDGFIDFNGINFNGRHAVHPRIVGRVHFENPTGPGWGRPGESAFEDPRLRGRDDRAYGPLPRDWAHYQGMYYCGNQVLISYRVGQSQIREVPGLRHVGDLAVFTRDFQIGPRPQELVLQVAHRPGGQLVQPAAPRAAVLRTPQVASPSRSADRTQFDGDTYLDVANPQDFDLTSKDYTIVARIKTTEGGTIFCKTADQPEWVPDGKTLFVRDGRLCFDIGWVGVVQSRRRVNDGRWHNVAMTYQHEPGRVRLLVDGRVEAKGELRPRGGVHSHVVRIGFTNNDFPEQQSHFVGQIQELRFYQRCLQPAELRDDSGEDRSRLVAHWRFAAARAPLRDRSGSGHAARRVTRPSSSNNTASGSLLAAISGHAPGVQWQASERGDLRLQIPAGEDPLRFTLHLTSAEEEAQLEAVLASLPPRSEPADLAELMRGGPPRWPQRLTTYAEIGSDEGPFAVDVLTHPVDNPWFCLLRLSGFDFFPGGDRAAVCSWDGSVWLVSGLSQLPASGSAAGGPVPLTWQRIASGLFQPLGLKIVDGRIYVSCRDQICVLHDLNGDGEIDYYENLNNDHQVTDHFHEFAMGLQTDEEGNFYYAKSARHALPALVPHHGTLLRVTRDGQRTDILATGFRAANGVCINPDGTFIVTDQEGHWNPKNRINWVREGGFYGNMFGYHDVRDSSDDAMQQPLCWITNEFDRSPAELLWVDSDAWGPLRGSLLNLSYGYGKIYVVPFERVGSQVQGGMCPLPLLRLPTGIMRGRFHPGDGQLYTCGMFAWAGNQQQPGGLYRVRYTGRPVYLPTGLHAKPGGLELNFTAPLDPRSASDAKNYAVRIWSLKRTANYGSEHYDERTLRVTDARLAADGKTLKLDIPQIQTTWCMEIRYRLRGADGQPVEGVIHNTIHQL